VRQAGGYLTRCVRACVASTTATCPPHPPPPQRRRLWLCVDRGATHLAWTRRADARRGVTARRRTAATRSGAAGLATDTAPRVGRTAERRATHAGATLELTAITHIVERRERECERIWSSAARQHSRRCDHRAGPSPAQARRADTYLDGLRDVNTVAPHVTLSCCPPSVSHSGKPLELVALWTGGPVTPASFSPCPVTSRMLCRADGKGGNGVCTPVWEIAHRASCCRRSASSEELVPFRESSGSHCLLRGS
jgi:hypothetical protein